MKRVGVSVLVACLFIALPAHADLLVWCLTNDWCYCGHSHFAKTVIPASEARRESF